MKHSLFFLTVTCLFCMCFCVFVFKWLLPADHIFNRTTNQATAFILRSTPVPTGIAEFRTVGTITEVFPPTEHEPCSLEVNSVNIVLDGIPSNDSSQSADPKVGKIEGIDCSSQDLEKLKGRYIEAVLQEVKNTDGTKFFSLRGDSKYYVRLMPEFTPGF